MNGKLAAVALGATLSAFAQGSINFIPGDISYVTSGTIVPLPEPPSGSASNIRGRSFDGSGYFTSTLEGQDTAFALKLGNGVQPFSAAGFDGGPTGNGASAVPEPSTVALAIFGGLSLFALRRKKAAA